MFFSSSSQMVMLVFMLFYLSFFSYFNLRVFFNIHFFLKKSGSLVNIFFFWRMMLGLIYALFFLNVIFSTLILSLLHLTLRTSLRLNVLLFLVFVFPFFPLHVILRLKHSLAFGIKILFPISVDLWFQQWYFGLNTSLPFGLKSIVICISFPVDFGIYTPLVTFVSKVLLSLLFM